MNLINITINNKKISVEPGYTIIQACEIAGVEIPRFCYHDRLKIAGNCRMCLVEVEGGPPKPVASCAMPIADGMIVHTDTENVRKAREGVMEFLLINHPLDCPICDQGGECDLQDQAMLYGKGISRFDEYKRAVPPKNFGPLIKTEMNRCIHCTRCVRFLSDIAGSPEIGTIGRGEDMEISTYIEKSISSEMSGNIIDLCPVGALTSKPYAFTARPWELQKVETIDILDAVGSNIRVDVRGKSVMRVLPRLNDDINEEWISDKTRFAYDGLRVQRLDRPYLKKDGKLRECTWSEALNKIAEEINFAKKTDIVAIAGDLVDVESAFLLKQLMNKIGVKNLECRQDGAFFDVSNRSLYTFNTTISGIENSDLCLLIGTNPRIEAPIINSRIRKRFLLGNYNIFNLGPNIEYTFETKYLGDSVDILTDILNEKHPFVSELKKSSKPMMVIGQDIFKREDAKYILSILSKIAEKFDFIQDDWNGFNVLHRYSGRVGALDIGFTSNVEINEILKNKKVVYLLGADECTEKIPDDAFVIYQGHHGDMGANRADVILPGAAYTEKDAIYVNTEGRAQVAYRAVFPPGNAKEDWLIIKDLSEKLNVDLEINNLDDIRNILEKIGLQFQNIGEIVRNKWQSFQYEGNRKFTEDKFKIENFNFYMTDPITRSSRIMAKCTEEFYVKSDNN
jgi:NADH-quinone oxidoreductase subunit G